MGRLLATLVATASAATVVTAAAPALPGATMVFVSPQGGAFDVWTARLDGSGMRRLTNTRAYDTAPDWSPDGKRIVFVREDRTADSLWIVNASGTGLHRLKPVKAKVLADPDWSPNGKLIAYATTAAPSGLWVVRPDGTHARPLARRGVSGGAPSWSPNGKRIVYGASCGPDRLHTCIYVVNANGLDRRQLTQPGNDDDWAPAWSPDGAEIAWIRGPELWSMKADGSSPHKVHPAGDWPDDSPPYDTSPSWAPDSSRVLFGTTYSPSSLAVVNRDGSGFAPLAPGLIRDGIHPSWRPR